MVLRRLCIVVRILIVCVSKSALLAGYDSCYSESVISPTTLQWLFFFFLVQQIHIWLAITLHPTSSRQKCLPLSAVGGHTYTKCVKGTIEFLEWVVFVSVRWAVRAEDRISTLPVILHVSHCQLRIQYVTIHKCFCHFRVWLWWCYSEIA